MTYQEIVAAGGSDGDEDSWDEGAFQDQWRYIVTLEVEVDTRRTVEYEVEVRADGVAQALLKALEMAWQEHGEEAPITIKRVA